ncbi:MAG: hypothetical protein IJ547_03590 [Clostridia bacterium]|nr:hypothetical protein [Clostridia bacterium]
MGRGTGHRRDRFAGPGGRLAPDRTWFVVTHQAKASYEKKIPRLDRFLKTPSRGFLSVCTEAPDQAAMKAFAEQIGHG